MGTTERTDFARTTPQIAKRYVRRELTWYLIALARHSKRHGELARVYSEVETILYNCSPESLSSERVRDLPATVEASAAVILGNGKSEVRKEAAYDLLAIASGYPSPSTVGEYYRTREECNLSFTR